MAIYTVQLKTLMDDENLKPLLDKALSTYPLYKPETDNEYVKSLIPTREEINTKLLNHYKRYEIGFETIEWFLYELEITMNEIMPIYNQRFKSVEIMSVIDDPFGNVDVTETFKETRSGTSKSTDSGSSSSNATDNSSTTSSATDTSSTTSNSDSHNKKIENDTANGNILGVNASDIDSVTHADKITWDKNGTENSTNMSGESSSSATSSGTSSTNSQSNSETNTENEGVVEHTFNKKGNQGVNTYAHDIIELRQTFIDVVKEIINCKEVRSLFMLVY